MVELVGNVAHLSSTSPKASGHRPDQTVRRGSQRRAAAAKFKQRDGRAGAPNWQAQKLKHPHPRLPAIGREPMPHPEQAPACSVLRGRQPKGGGGECGTVGRREPGAAKQSEAARVNEARMARTVPLERLCKTGFGPRPNTDNCCWPIRTAAPDDVPAARGTSRSAAKPQGLTKAHCPVLVTTRGRPRAGPAARKKAMCPAQPKQKRELWACW